MDTKAATKFGLSGNRGKGRREGNREKEREREMTDV